MERYGDRAIEIINELHTERLDYDSEYLPLIDCANRCKGYEDAEEQGLLVRLPCKKGDELVAHGHWIEVAKMAGVAVFRCSVCGKEHPMIPSAFCRDCGAKMEEAR